MALLSEKRNFWNPIYSKTILWVCISQFLDCIELCVFGPLCHRISFASISYLAAITGDGVAFGGIWLCIDVPVQPVLWYRCRSGWGVCHPQLLNSSFSSCLSPNAAAFSHCPDKRHRDGDLLQMSLIMNSVKPWFTPAWRCGGNVGRDSLIQKTWANGTYVVLVVLVGRRGGRGESGGAGGWGGGTGPKTHLKEKPFFFSLWCIAIREDLHTSKGPSFMCHDGYHWWQLLSVRLHVFEPLHATFVWSSADFDFWSPRWKIMMCVCRCV